MNVDTIDSSRIPHPRSPGVDLDAPVPRHWFGGNAVATHIANGVNLPWIEYCHQAGLPIPRVSQRFDRTWINTERDPGALPWWAGQVARRRVHAGRRFPTFRRRTLDRCRRQRCALHGACGVA